MRIVMQKIEERDLCGEIYSEKRSSINIPGFKSGDCIPFEKEITGISGRSVMVIRKALIGLEQELLNDSDKVKLVDARSSFHCNPMHMSKKTLLNNLFKIFASIHISMSVLYKSIKEKQFVLLKVTVILMNLPGE